MIRFLIIGDVVGRPGRRCLANNLPRAIETYKPDAIIANGENSAGGFGINEKTYHEFLSLGVDGITTGNHWADKKDIINFLPQAKSLVIPGNIGNNKGRHPGYRILKTKNNCHRFALINLIGRVFMADGSECPFTYADKLLEELRDYRVVLIDMHAETTSEKYALAQYLKGKVSVIWGTHTHIPTADAHIMNEKTGYISDIGMSGPYDSVIGIKSESSISRFLSGERRPFEVAKKDLWFCAAVADVDETTGFCHKIEHFIWK